MASRDENKKAMEQRIYDAALDLFCEMGYLKTTLADIAAEAGVSTRTLYNYFPTKESILRKFGEDNIASLRIYAESLPPEMDIRDKVLSVMQQDFKMMFCLFDVSYILHSSRDDNGMLMRFELRNVLATESIYRDMFREVQKSKGVEPNSVATLCASSLMGIYRQCTDLYRFLRKGCADPDEVVYYYASHLDTVWDSMMKSLVSPPTHIQEIIMSDGRLFGSDDR
ncbi:TetR/AcrR family transcriptional regulator [Adlercreutzia sp. ZJ154]|uniref:TetR/AcrR family transcriptional regulator n=1 Tax=Adlercreutzia sp. ZJ154 TaxID=2709790 RepID=UPI00197D9588|nr:TetR/AcrR family transcriptional regulator [Adlercreutzia sp. ZJ154]